MFLVYGLKKSGVSIIKLFQKKNQDFSIWDDSRLVRKIFNKQYGKKIFFEPKNKKLSSFDKIFISPGISIRQKKFQIKNKTYKINRDLNLYLSNLDNEKIIAVTGTNGKSTTTKLIGQVLKENNIRTFVGGNIGEPLCNAFISKQKFNFHVIELSSFQLETVNKINSKISIITNLASDHLDRYKNINDYINQKKNIISLNGINLISLDDKYSKKLFLQKNIKNKISFSLYDEKADIFMGYDYILDNYFKKNRRLKIKKISLDLEGQFNKQNILITYICSKILKLPTTTFIKVIKNFKGLPYRSKLIYNDKHLRIINNSKSTNLNSTINSIKNYNEIYLIIGGEAKEKNFEILLNYKDRIRYVYVFGKSGKFIEKKLNKSLIVKKFITLKFAVKKVLQDVNNKNNNIKSNILFAPSCSSYDQYLNFEERGEDFNNLIKKYFNKK